MTLTLLDAFDILQDVLSQYNESDIDWYMQQSNGELIVSLLIPPTETLFSPREDWHLTEHQLARLTPALFRAQLLRMLARLGSRA